MNITTERIGVKFASALLLRYGEVSKEDIRAMPFFMSPNEPEAVIRCLLETFDVEVYPRKVSTHPLPEWEEVIRLRNRVHQRQENFT